MMHREEPQAQPFHLLQSRSQTLSGQLVSWTLKIYQQKSSSLETIRAQRPLGSNYLKQYLLTTMSLMTNDLLHSTVLGRISESIGGIIWDQYNINYANSHPLICCVHQQNLSSRKARTFFSSSLNSQCQSQDPVPSKCSINILKCINKYRSLGELIILPIIKI